eukprot:m.167414 g.167414  ORF g.167414 m.167414 type:complete len:56 (-) comp31460_c5_seq11:85-252(-)
MRLLCLIVFRLFITRTIAASTAKTRSWKTLKETKDRSNNNNTKHIISNNNNNPNM